MKKEINNIPKWKYKNFDLDDYHELPDEPFGFIQASIHSAVFLYSATLPHRSGPRTVFLAAFAKFAPCLQTEHCSDFPFYGAVYLGAWNGNPD